MTDKQIAVEALGRLSETASLQEIAEELQVVAAIRQGQDDAVAGLMHSHEEVEQIFSTWTEQWATKTPSTK